MPMDPPASGTVERANGQTGSLAQRIRASQHLAAASEARTRVSDWRAEIADTACGKSLIQLFAAHPMLDGLVMSLAEGSRYLWELARADPERLVSLLEAEPERRFDDILTDAKRAIAAAHGEAEVMRLLRRMKSEAALLIALADIGGVWSIPLRSPRESVQGLAAVQPPLPKH